MIKSLLCVSAVHSICNTWLRYRTFFPEGKVPPTESPKQNFAASREIFCERGPSQLLIRRSLTQTAHRIDITADSDMVPH